ncbi:MAG: MarR family transcriptional regulator [Hyphomicrobium sp.]|uniref:HVO_A0114 family putative DNA-binding protein n=1 Tax=Hyphomicrobium sp. TaxID=82 RepID=UPI003D0BDD08
MSEIRILHIGIAPREYVKQRTMEVARGKPFAPDEPKHWVSSLESLARVLTDSNMLLLEMIRNSKPQSMAELAKLSGRAKSNLSRTLHTMESLGLVELRDVPGGKKAPQVIYDSLKFEYPLRPRKPQKPKAA